MIGEGRPDALRFVLFKEGNVIMAVCLERYIGAQGDTMEDVKRRLCTVYRAELDASQARGQGLFGDIPPAPEEYHDMWDQGPPAVMRGRIYDKNSDSQPLALAA